MPVKIPKKKIAKYYPTSLARFIDEEMEKIEADERFHYPPANVTINAPLALIQVSLTARMQTLKQVLELL